MQNTRILLFFYLFKYFKFNGFVQHNASLCVIIHFQLYTVKYVTLSPVLSILSEFCFTHPQVHWFSLEVKNSYILNLYYVYKYKYLKFLKTVENGRF